MNITVSFGGRNWDTSPTYFAMTTTSGNQCIGSLFAPGSSNPVWIIGDAFLLCFRSPPPLRTAVFSDFLFRKCLFRVQV